MRMFGEKKPENAKVLALIEGNSMSQPQLIKLDQATLGFRTIKSQERERANQDLIFVMQTPDAIWLVVADGMGQYKDTPKAIEIFRQALQDHLPGSHNLNQVIAQTQQNIDATISTDLPVYSTTEYVPGGGLVFTAVKLQFKPESQTSATIFQLGDVRAIIAGEDPEDTGLETQDQHNPLQPHRVTSYVSTESTTGEVLVKLIPHPSTILEAGDLVIICSDGVTGVLTSDEILDIVHTALKKGQSVADATKEVCDKAQVKGSQDDVTCLIYQQK